MNRKHDALFVLATRIKFMCPMNFAKFPMDAHTCKFQVIAHSKMYSMVQIYSTPCVKFLELRIRTINKIMILCYFAKQFSLESQQS